jgi:hypothetical protein
MAAAARPIAAAVALASMIAAGGVGAAAAGDCRDPDFGWSETRPAVNLRHVFCGEIDDGRPKGLHSARLIETSAAVLGIARRRGEGGGVSSAVVRFANGKEKLSTLFPDACTVGEVTRSIVHAANHAQSRHPAWGELGPSAPAAGAPGYCLDDRGRPLIIRFGRLGDGRVNTAFPQGEGR